MRRAGGNDELSLIEHKAAPRRPQVQIFSHVRFRYCSSFVLMKYRRMHPPRFLSNHRRLDWPDCLLELHCCKGKTVYPVRLLAERSGNLTFADNARGPSQGGYPALTVV